VVHSPAAALSWGGRGRSRKPVKCRGGRRAGGLGARSPAAHRRLGSAL